MVEWTPWSSCMYYSRKRSSHWQHLYGHVCALAGAKDELLFLSAFAELTLLLPDHNINIHFIGPELPEPLHSMSCRVDEGAPGKGV